MNTEVLSILVGQAMPMVIEVINNRLPDNSKIRYTASLLVSVIVGGLMTYVAGEFDTTNILSSIGLVFASSQTAYRTWFKDSAIELKINQK